MMVKACFGTKAVLMSRSAYEVVRPGACKHKLSAGVRSVTVNTVPTTHGLPVLGLPSIV